MENVPILIVLRSRIQQKKKQLKIKKVQTMRKLLLALCCAFFVYMPNVNANPDNDLFQHGVRVKRKGLNLASAA